MAGLVPAIHVFGAAGKDVDARDKPGHDEERLAGATAEEEVGPPLPPHHIWHKYQPCTASAWPIPANVVSRRHFFRPPHQTRPFRP